MVGDCSRIMKMVVNCFQALYYYKQYCELPINVSDWCYVKSSDVVLCFAKYCKNTAVLTSRQFSQTTTVPLRISYQPPRQSVQPEPTGLPKQQPCHLQCWIYSQVLCVSYLHIYHIRNKINQFKVEKYIMVNGIAKLRHVAILTIPNSLCIFMRCIVEKSMNLKF